MIDRERWRDTYDNWKLQTPPEYEEDDDYDNDEGEDEDCEYDD